SMTVFLNIRTSLDWYSEFLRWRPSLRRQVAQPCFPWRCVASVAASVGQHLTRRSDRFPAAPDSDVLCCARKVPRTGVLVQATTRDNMRRNAMGLGFVREYRRQKRDSRGPRAPPRLLEGNCALPRPRRPLGSALGARAWSARPS